MMKIYWAAALILLTVFSCDNNKNLQSEIAGFTGSRVLLPAAMAGGNADVFDVENKLIVWFDSLECGSCRLKQLYAWNDDPVMQYARAMGNRFNVFLVFSPKAADVHYLKLTLKNYNVSFPVLLDETGAFIEQNPHIPADTRLHSFLLDKDNKVVLTGNPVGNESLWELYKEQIRELINR